VSSKVFDTFGALVETSSRPEEPLEAVEGV
jgi:hypothetical protein